MATLLQRIISITNSCLKYEFAYYKDLPSEKAMENTWHQYALEEKTNITNEIGLLSTNQAKMMIAIAKYGDNITPMSKELIALTKFSLSSASQAVKALESKNYLMLTNQNTYKLVDPLIKYIFSIK